MCTVNKSAHTKKVWKLIECTSYVKASAVNSHLFRQLLKEMDSQHDTPFFHINVSACAVPF